MIPPKLCISDYMGIIKGRTAIRVFNKFRKLKKKPYWGNHFWSRGYCVDTVGLDADKICRYVKYQEAVRPGKVAYFSGCESRPGRLASHRVASPWIDGSNPRD